VSSCFFSSRAVGTSDETAHVCAGWWQLPRCRQPTLRVLVPQLCHSWYVQTNAARPLASAKDAHASEPPARRLFLTSRCVDRPSGGIPYDERSIWMMLGPFGVIHGGADHSCATRCVAFIAMRLCCRSAPPIVVIDPYVETAKLTASLAVPCPYAFNNGRGGRSRRARGMSSLEATPPAPLREEETFAFGGWRPRPSTHLFSMALIAHWGPFASSCKLLFKQFST